MIKLNLGCGTKHIPNYVNIDADQICNPDKIEDVCTLPSFKPNTVDLIYCAHLLEHFPRNQTIEILKRWYKILKPGGILRCSVPNLDIIFRHYLLYKDLEKLMSLIYGSQQNEYQFHKAGWTFETLKPILMGVGFFNVKIFNWQNLEHSHVDDYSQAYLPHMQKETGILMSLNVEAVK